MCLRHGHPCARAEHQVPNHSADHYTTGGKLCIFVGPRRGYSGLCLPAPRAQALPPLPGSSMALGRKPPFFRLSSMFGSHQVRTSAIGPECLTRWKLAKLHYELLRVKTRNEQNE